MNNLNIDPKELRAQRETLSIVHHAARTSQFRRLTEAQVKHLEGLQNLLDALQDDCEPRVDVWAGEHELKHDCDRGHTHAK